MPSFSSVIRTAAVLLGAAAVLFSQKEIMDSGGPLSPEQAAYDVQFYHLSLTIDPSRQSISGSNLIEFKALQPMSRLVLDLDSTLVVDSVTVGKPAIKCGWERAAGELFIDLGADVDAGRIETAIVYYRGSPRTAADPPWSGGFIWSRTPSGLPWVSVACQNEGADLWWPCKDHPSDEPDSMALSFTVPKGLACISNGRLRRQVENPDGTCTFHWFVSTPINNYGVSFYLAPYEKMTLDYRGIDGRLAVADLWVLPEERERLPPLAQEIPRQLTFLENLFGPYPFRADKYAVVQAPYLGMEHQTCIAYGAPQGYAYGGYGLEFDGLHLHEAAHEWWGNMLTAADWKDYWLHEAFATYTEALYAERCFGEEGYRRVMSTFRRSIRNRRPITRPQPMTADEAYSGDIYFKGAWVLHTLRKFVGDEAFFRLLETFLYPLAEKSATDGSVCRFVSTEEWLNTVAAVCGDLQWFFDVYLYEAALPQLLVRIRDRQLSLKWKVESGAPFKLPVPVTIGERTAILNPSDEWATVDLVPFVPPVIDPEETILMEVVRVSFADGTRAPEGFVLGQNYPNPANALTTIPFVLPNAGEIELVLFDVQGVQVLPPVRGVFGSGEGSVVLDLGALPAGVYTYQLTFGKFNDIRRLTVIR